MSRLPQALKERPRLADWIAPASDGRFVVLPGKVELGQGVVTAIWGIAAAALGVSVDDVVLTPAATDTSPDEGFTVGSLSITTSGPVFFAVGQCWRSLMLRVASERFGCDRDRLDCAGGLVLRDGVDSGMRVADLIVALDRDAVAREDLLDERTMHGLPQGRVDLAGKLAGSGFLHDLTFDNLLHARMLRGAPNPSGDVGPLPQGVTCCRVGDLVALVGADEGAVARAAERLRAKPDWDPAPELHHADLTLEAADLLRTVPSARVAEAARSNLRHQATFTRPWLLHGSIGPSCAVARWHPEGAPTLEVWSHTQGVFPLRRSLAAAFDLDARQVVVRHAMGAGCYGHNGADDVAADAAVLARAYPGRPVRVQWSRADEMLFAPAAPAMTVMLEAGLNDKGTPVDWTITVRSPTHGSRPGTPAGFPTLAGREALGQSEPEASDLPLQMGGGGLRNAIAPYDLPEQQVVHEFVAAPALRASAMRGLGAHANVFAIERFMDELALRAETDPLEYRLGLMSEARGMAVLTRVAQMSGWGERPASGGGHGLGLAFSRYKLSAAWVAIAAEVQIEEDVRLTRVWAAVDAGRVIDPVGARNQIEGGIVQSASWALMEQIVPDGLGRRPMAWADYPILRFSQLPQISIDFTGDDMAPPLGIGEVCVGPVSAAIANACAHALAVPVRRLPVDRDTLERALLSDT